jgi:GAF domain-containing protein
MGDERDLMTRLEAVYASGAPVAALDSAAGVLGARLGELGADAGFVAAPSADGRTVEVARVTPFSEQPVRLAFPVDAPYPLAAAIRRDEELYITSNETLACDHPGLVRVRGEDHACATVPLHGSDGSVIGSANISFEDPREFTAADRTAFAALFAACAAELARAQAR